jgi:hypothetical protein
MSGWTIRIEGGSYSRCSEYELNIRVSNEDGRDAGTKYEIDKRAPYVKCKESYWTTPISNEDSWKYTIPKSRFNVVIYGVKDEELKSELIQYGIPENQITFE